MCSKNDVSGENHSIEYVTTDGVHTNHIEGSWAGIKQKIPVRARVAGDIGDYLMEFVWRRRNQSDLWNAALFALNEVVFE